jgi:hypothetical protein
MKKIIFAISLILSLSAQADDPECTAIALSAFTAKYIELNGCGITGNISARGLDLYGNCALSTEVTQKVMSTAKNNVAAMSCSKSREMYTNLTNAFALINH